MYICTCKYMQLFSWNKQFLLLIIYNHSKHSSIRIHQLNHFQAKTNSSILRTLSLLYKPRQCVCVCMHVCLQRQEGYFPHWHHYFPSIISKSFNQHNIFYFHSKHINHCTYLRCLSLMILQ